MKSMTGYGNADFHNDDYDIEVEIKSVNSRFLDLKIMLPRELQSYENTIKELISSEVKRAKIDIRINFNDKRLPEYQIDEKKLIAYANLLRKAKELVNDYSALNLELVLNQPNVLSFDTKNHDESTFSPILTQVIKQALTKHQELAKKEGQKLKEFFNESFEKIKNAIVNIESSIPQFKEKIYDQYKTNIENIMKEKLEDDFIKRLFVEVAIYIDKNDITEELIRLNSHLINIKDKLETESTDMGKSLNFIFQEMQREINTIGSKYNNNDVFDQILQIKEEVEKCREQIQNVE